MQILYDKCRKIFITNGTGPHERNGRRYSEEISIMDAFYFPDALLFCLSAEQEEGIAHLRLVKAGAPKALLPVVGIAEKEPSFVVGGLFQGSQKAKGVKLPGVLGGMRRLVGKKCGIAHLFKTIVSQIEPVMLPAHRKAIALIGIDIPHQLRSVVEGIDAKLIDTVIVYLYGTVGRRRTNRVLNPRSSVAKTPVYKKGRLNIGHIQQQ